MLPDDVVSLLESELGTRVVGSQGLGGGCIANASRADTSHGPLFVKWSRDEAAAAFPSEAKGLQALRKADAALRVPAPRLVRQAGEALPGVLVLEWIEPGPRGQEFWEAFGAALADLHRHGADQYGFDGDNFIGRLPQRNDWSASWSEFFASARLEPQVRWARNAGRWRTEWSPAAERLMHRMDALLPKQPEPSLLHGDLWSGNVLVTNDGRAALVDPAAYYGHREADLAMTELFGGFDDRFYAAYRQAWELEEGYDDRREVYNLYHLINHLNHFGSGYAGAVGRILDRF